MPKHMLLNKKQMARIVINISEYLNLLPDEIRSMKYREGDATVYSSRQLAFAQMLWRANYSSVLKQLSDEEWQAIEFGLLSAKPWQGWFDDQWDMVEALSITANTGEDRLVDTVKAFHIWLGDSTDDSPYSDIARTVVHCIDHLCIKIVTNSDEFLWSPKPCPKA